MVDAGIGRIAELLEHQVAVGMALDHLPGRRDGATHAQPSLGEHQARSISGEQLAPLHAHRFRHREGEGDPPGRRDKGQSDARVSAGGFDQLPA